MIEDCAHRALGVLERAGVNAVGAAVSGGADSVYLLHFLAERGLAAAVLHVNHKLRGPESDLDEAFVRNLAASLHLPFHSIALPVAEGNLEQEARHARYAFFERQIAAGHCAAVATGHTKDDQAETVLARFLRGAGTAGLSGILPETAGGIVRPLLHLGRAEIRASLAERGIPWREDASNLDTALLRNRLRLEIIPRLEALNPSLADVLASTAEWAQDEESYWRSQLAEFETRSVIRNREALLIRTGHLTSLPVAVQRRAIRRLIETVRSHLRSIDFRHAEAIRHLVHQTEGSGRIQLPGLDVYRSFDWLRLSPIGFDLQNERNFDAPLPVPGQILLPERGIGMVIELKPAAERVYNEVDCALDYPKCSGSPVLRNWRPGDRWGQEKIKSLFQEHRIPLWERRNWPVIVSGETIVWTRKFGAAAGFAAGPDSTELLLVREVL